MKLTQKIGKTSLSQHTLQKCLSRMQFCMHFAEITVSG